MGAKFRPRVYYCEPLLKLGFGPAPIPIFRCVDIPCSGHSFIADKLRRSEPPQSFVILTRIPRPRIGQSLLQCAALLNFPRRSGQCWRRTLGKSGATVYGLHPSPQRARLVRGVCGDGAKTSLPKSTILVRRSAGFAGLEGVCSSALSGMAHLLHLLPRRTCIISNRLIQYLPGIK